MLKIKEHPGVCAAEQQGGFQNAALLGKNDSGHLSRNSSPSAHPETCRGARNLPGPAGHLHGAGLQVFL